MHGINAVSAATDAIIAVALCLLLHSSRSGFRKSERIINRLIIFTVNTGLLTGICAILTLICNIAFPGTFIYMIFYIMVARSTYQRLFSKKMIFGMCANESSSLYQLPSRYVSLDYFSNCLQLIKIRIRLIRLNTRDNIRRGGMPEGSSNGMTSVPLDRINVNQYDSKVRYRCQATITQKCPGMH